MCHQTTHLYLCKCTQTSLPHPCSLHTAALAQQSFLNNSPSINFNANLSTNTDPSIRTSTNLPLCAGNQGIETLLVAIDEECPTHREMRIAFWIAEDNSKDVRGDYDFMTSGGLHSEIGGGNADLGLILENEAVLEAQARAETNTKEDEEFEGLNFDDDMNMDMNIIVDLSSNEDLNLILAPSVEPEQTAKDGDLNSNITTFPDLDLDFDLATALEECERAEYEKLISSDADETEVRDVETAGSSDFSEKPTSKSIAMGGSGTM